MPRRRRSRRFGRRPVSSSERLERLRFWARVAAAIAFIPVGLVHIIEPDRLMPIMPPMIPFPREVIIGTGVAEIFGGLGILWPPTRKAAAIGLALYAICVYPANVYHAFANAHVPPLPDSWWYHGPRLVFQPVFVWWALFAGGLIHRSARSANRTSGSCDSL